MAVEEQISVITHAFEDGSVVGVDPEEAIGKAARYIGLDRRTDDHAIPVLNELDRHCIGAVVAVEGDMMRHK